MARLPEFGWSDSHHEVAQENDFPSWDIWIANIESERNLIICGAKIKTGSIRPCRTTPMPNGRCRSHGGKTPAPGPAHPNWQHGSYSLLFPTLPARLQDAANDAFHNKEYLSTRKNIAVLEARGDELLSQLNTGETGQSWSNLGEVLAELQQAVDDPEREREVGELLATAQHIQSDGIRDYILWGEYRENSESVRRLRDTEVNFLKSAKESMRADAVIALIGRLLGIIKVRVKDPSVLQGIMRDVDGQFGRKAITAGEASGSTGSEASRSSGGDASVTDTEVVG